MLLLNCPHAMQNNVLKHLTKRKSYSMVTRVLLVPLRFTPYKILLLNCPRKMQNNVFKNLTKSKSYSAVIRVLLVPLRFTP
jgi:hypothetical protein